MSSNVRSDPIEQIQYDLAVRASEVEQEESPALEQNPAPEQNPSQNTSLTIITMVGPRGATEKWVDVADEVDISAPEQNPSQNTDDDYDGDHDHDHDEDDDDSDDDTSLTITTTVGPSGATEKWVDVADEVDIPAPEPFLSRTLGGHLNWKDRDIVTAANDLKSYVETEKQMKMCSRSNGQCDVISTNTNNENQRYTESKEEKEKDVRETLIALNIEESCDQVYRGVTLPPDLVGSNPFSQPGLDLTEDAFGLADKNIKSETFGIPGSTAFQGEDMISGACNDCGVCFQDCVRPSTAKSLPAMSFRLWAESPAALAQRLYNFVVRMELGNITKVSPTKFAFKAETWQTVNGYLAPCRVKVRIYSDNVDSKQSLVSFSRHSGDSLAFQKLVAQALRDLTLEFKAAQEIPENVWAISDAQSPTELPATSAAEPMLSPLLDMLQDDARYISLVQLWTVNVDKDFLDEFEITEENPDTKHFHPAAIDHLMKTLQAFFGEEATKEQVKYCTKKTLNIDRTFLGTSAQFGTFFEIEGVKEALDIISGDQNELQKSLKERKKAISLARHAPFLSCSTILLAT